MGKQDKMTEDEIQAENALCNEHFQAARQKQAAGLLDEAAEMYGVALSKGWAIDYALCDLGTIALRQGLAGRAERLLLAAIDVNPNLGAALTNLAVLYRLLHRNQEAVQWSERALQVNQNDANAHNARGSGLFALLDYEGAAEAFRTALRLDPDHENAAGNLAGALACLDRYEEAMLFYKMALKRSPRDATCNFSYGKLLLKFGYFKEGWSRYEARWATTMSGMQRHKDIPALTRQLRIAGRTILVHQEQGLGDCIQFCRLLKPLKDKNCEIVFEVHESLLPVMAPLSQYARLIRKYDDPGLVDFQVPLLSLPHILELELNTIPSADGCFQVPVERRTQWEGLVGQRQRPRIGVAWSGRAEYWMDAQRSIQLADFIELDSFFETFSIQKEVRESDAGELAKRGYRYFGDELKDFADTGALIECMDLVITVDTGVAHLAGSLGKEVWLLISINSDWRWLHERTDSPWYPSMRIFRQNRSEGWRGVMQQVRKALAAYKNH